MDDRRNQRDKGKIEIRPKSSGGKYVLSEMVKRITKDNIHPETDWGPSVGREII